MPINRVTDILIGKDVSSGAGFLRVLDKDMNALTAGKTITDSDIIYIEQTLTGGTNKKISLPIHGKNVRNWSGKSAVNAVNQVVTVTTPNVISDQEYGLYITLLSDKDLSQGNRRYYAQYFSSSAATALEISTGIVAAINAASFPVPVTGSLSGTNILITGDNPSVYFSVGKAIGFDSSVTASTTTAWDPGLGTYDEIYALEDKAKGYEGYMSERRTFIGDLPGFSRPEYYTVGTALAVTGVYDLYLIDHDQPIDLQGINASNAKPTTTYIAVVAGSSTFSQVNFEGVLNPWFASCPGAFNAVNL